MNYSEISRVRTIPVLGYWELGDICMYWVVSLSGDTIGYWILGGFLGIVLTLEISNLYNTAYVKTALLHINHIMYAVKIRD